MDQLLSKGKKSSPAILAVVFGVAACAPGIAPGNSDEPVPISIPCYRPSADDDLFVTSAAVSRHQRDGDFLVETPTFDMTYEEIVGLPALDPSMLASFYRRNEIPTPIAGDTRLAVDGDTSVIPRDEVPWSEMEDFLEREYDASYVFRVTLPGYSCDGTQAIIYMDLFCGMVCGFSVIHILQREEGIWRARSDAHIQAQH